MAGVGYQNYPDRPEQNTTEAEKFASKLTSMRMPDKAQTEEDRALNDRISQLKAQARQPENRDAAAQEINRMFTSGEITRRRAQSLINGMDDSYFEGKIKRMQTGELEAVRKIANDQERQQIDEILTYRGTKAQKKPGPPPMPLNLQPQPEKYKGATIQPRPQ